MTRGAAGSVHTDLQVDREQGETFIEVVEEHEMADGTTTKKVINFKG